MKRTLLLTALLFGGALAQKPVTVGSKLDTEGSLLGQMILLVLEDAGIRTVDKTILGDTSVVRKALLAGEIDIYPEYTGTALNVFFPRQQIDAAAFKDPKKSYATAKRLDAANGVTWLTPAAANNTWAVAVPRKLATENRLKSLADLARYLKDGGRFKIAGSPEFFNRDDSFKAFEQAYGFKLRADQKLVLAGAATPQTQAAAAQGANGVNAAMAYGTDGSLAALDLITLSDPKGAQPVYAPAPIVRDATLKAYPQLAPRLNKVFASLDDATLQRLNGEIAVEGKNPRDVARAYLKGKKLIR
ncbi:osmoprotectant transport system substrate-binding protein [Deinobacterium chartae]|uniref:Osmoprotectant transport system substrate-binding protein n=1 Tax=Deinobacterium chartae TaxID=521158 RepID=A0A841HVH9_9DEIO|nr:ABC transporter substrate-binding protein [Deinobacterium chartae]MBB6096926.1 osmoprotectant transport system substrate-binding protein [Deinobacterium chartae]